MVEPPKSSTFTAPLHSSQNTTSARDLVTHITGSTKNIPVGALLEGKVLSQTSSGLTTLKTSHGDITFQTQIGLLKGSLVTLRITSTGEDFQARLVTINGQSLLEYLGGKAGDPAQSARVNTTFTLPQDEVVNQSLVGKQASFEQTAAGGKTAVTPNDTVLQRNASLAITLLTADKAGIDKLISSLPTAVKEAFIANLQNVASRSGVSIPAENIQQALARTGNVFEFKVTNYQLPQNAPTTSNGLPAGNTTVSQQGGNAAAGITGQAASQASVQVGGGGASSPNTSSPINAASVPSSSTASSLAQSNQTTTGLTNTTANAANNIANTPQIVVDSKSGNIRLQALVIGQDALGQSVIKTPLGTFNSHNNLPKGALVELELSTLVYISPTSGTASSLAAQNVGANDAVGKLLNFWKMFASTDTAKIFQDAGSNRLDAFQSRFPNAGSDLGANLLRYFSAVAKQDPRELLGKTLTDFLQRTQGGQEALEQLGRDLGANRQLQQQLQYDWKSLIFPVVSDDKWYANRLLLKEYEGKNAEGEPERGVRFVIELDMEKLGPLQLDGLVRNSIDNQFFDLTIRSELPIPKAARDGIFGIFQEAQEALDVKGRLVFQLTPNIPDPIRESGAEEQRKGNADDDSIVV